MCQLGYMEHRDSLSSAPVKSTGPNDSFSSPASDVLSAGVFIACLFRYVTLGSHRSEEWRKQRAEFHDGAFLHDNIMERQLREWEHLLSVIKADEFALRQQQQHLISTFFNTHHHFLEPHEPMQNALYQLVCGMMHFDHEKRMTVREALHLVETQLMPAAMLTHAEHSSNTFEHITPNTNGRFNQWKSAVRVVRCEREQTEQQQQPSMKFMGLARHQPTSSLSYSSVIDIDPGKENPVPHECNSSESKGLPTDAARKPLSAISANRQNLYQN